MDIFFLFLLSLTAGVLSTLFWIPEKSLGRGYFQMNALIALGLLSLAAAVVVLGAVVPFGDPAGVGFLAMWLALAATFGYHAAIWRESWRTGRWIAFVALAAATTSYLQAGWSLTPSHAPLPHRALLLHANLALGALLVGWSLVTMLLGHWYLISPKLSFRFLTVFCQILLAITFVRVAATGASLLTAYSVDPFLEPHPWRLVVHMGGGGIFFWFRLLWGLLMPILLGIMSLRCARQGANQSATGILYVLFVGTMIGEITALYLTLTTGVPL